MKRSKAGFRQQSGKFDNFYLIKNALINALLFSLGVLIYYLIIRLMDSNQGIFYPLQMIEANIIYYIQKPFAQVALDGSRLIYDGFSATISWDCIGLRQSLFFLVLVFSFFQIQLKHRLWALAFVPLIIILNLIRIAVLLPIFNIFGLDAVNAFHEFSYTYGNGILVFVLFGLWYYISMNSCNLSKASSIHSRK
jgi:exosortase/archaeosortase family protein